MAMDTFDEAAARQALSALADGELAGDAGEAAFMAWRRDAGARRDWHAWHLIGDVLRSEDLASDPRADLRFCVARAAAPGERGGRARARAGRGRGCRSGFGCVARRVRVPADGCSPRRRRPASFWSPAPSRSCGPSMRRRQRRLPSPSAMPRRRRQRARFGERGRASRQRARRSDRAAGRRASPTAALIRDAQLDRYLVAHKQFAGTSALGVPSVFLRSATVDSTSR